MDRLPYALPYPALALGALLFFGISVYFGFGHNKKKSPSPPQSFPLQLAYQQPALTIRVQKQIKVSSESDFTAGWWTSSKIFDLERRAIFSKTWLYVTHRNQFTKAGDYHQFQIAGFRFFLILGKDNVLRGFHNVCRHRAYPVVRKESGSSTILGCKYHGWSYNTQGALTKAPQFDNVEGFDKTQNGLFPIATSVVKGMVFVNFDPTKASDTPPFESYSMNQKICRALAELKCTHRWEFEGQFNWKVGLFSFGIDTPRSTGGISSSETTATEVSTHAALTGFLSLIERAGKLLSLAPSEGAALFSAHLSPSTTIYLDRDRELWFSVTLLPHSPSRTIVKCEVYQLGPTTTEIQTNPEIELSAVEALKDHLRGAIQACEERQCQLQDRVYEGDSDSAIHDCKSESSWELQYQILEQLRQHSKLERSVGEEIWPAFVGAATTDDGKETDRLCKELEICATVEDRDVLEW